ncbi:hypothetical protein DSO57_1009315 [Entomophthora muscae]|uniref:Uncharacterized protein n=1 Tax=Entomophthora muscae TaxID=34485 RepID=A0ACC2RLM8_9FUNG|nr:hypothetical protein DSO57_1009315 [Entomophthora muscae]
MKAIQNAMEERHRIDREREEELTNAEETGNFIDPSVPDEVRMEDDTLNLDRLVYPDMGEWQKSHESAKSQKKPQKKNPNKQEPNIASQNPVKTAGSTRQQGSNQMGS